MKSLLLLIALPLLHSCAASPTALPAGRRIGEPMEARPVVALATADASPADYFERTLLLEATVSAVCQPAGCWMKIEDEGHVAMVRWEEGCGGAYAFPRDAAGKRVILQGSFYPKSISEEDARHIEGEAVEGTTIPRETYEINASAVLVIGDEPAG